MRRAALAVAALAAAGCIEWNTLAVDGGADAVVARDLAFTFADDGGGNSDLAGDDDQAATIDLAIADTPAPDLAPDRRCMYRASPLPSHCYPPDGGDVLICIYPAGLLSDGGACSAFDDPAKIACGGDCATCPKSWTLRAPVDGGCP